MGAISTLAGSVFWFWPTHWRTCKSILSLGDALAAAAAVAPGATGGAGGTLPAWAQAWPQTRQAASQASTLVKGCRKLTLKGRHSICIHSVKSFKTPIKVLVY
jgi:hypothetical protein